MYVLFRMLHQVQVWQRDGTEQHRKRALRYRKRARDGRRGRQAVHWPLIQEIRSIAASNGISGKSRCLIHILVCICKQIRSCSAWDAGRRDLPAKSTSRRAMPQRLISHRSCCPLIFPSVCSCPSLAGGRLRPLRRPLLTLVCICECYGLNTMVNSEYLSMTQHRHRVSH